MTTIFDHIYSHFINFTNLNNDHYLQQRTYIISYNHLNIKKTIKKGFIYSSDLYTCNALRYTLFSWIRCQTFQWFTHLIRIPIHEHYFFFKLTFSTNCLITSCNEIKKNRTVHFFLLLAFQSFYRILKMKM